ncbi:4483_t:CDS:2, partial [Scutellospora calospora]
VIVLIHTSYLILRSQSDTSIIIDIINNNEFWLKLELFYELLKLYDYVIKILETEKTMLGQLNYTNQEGPFSASFIKNPSFTKFPLRYWHTLLSATLNLSEFACRLLSILPNSVTSKR